MFSCVHSTRVWSRPDLVFPFVLVKLVGEAAVGFFTKKYRVQLIHLHTVLVPIRTNRTQEKIHEIFIWLQRLSAKQYLAVRGILVSLSFHDTINYPLCSTFLCANRFELVKLWWCVSTPYIRCYEVHFHVVVHVFLYVCQSSVKVIEYILP